MKADRRHGSLGRPARRVAADLTTRYGASSATSSTTRTSHGLDLVGRPRSSTLRGSKASPGVDDLRTRCSRKGLSNLVLGHVWAFGADSYPKSGARRAWGCSERTTPIEQAAAISFARILVGRELEPEAARRRSREPGVDVKEGRLSARGRRSKTSKAPTRCTGSSSGAQANRPCSPSVRGRTAAGHARSSVVPTSAGERPPAPAHLDGGQPQEGRGALGRARWLRVHPGHGQRRVIRTSIVTISRRSAKTRSCSTSAINHGGYIADYIVNILGWTPQMGAMTPRR